MPRSIHYRSNDQLLYSFSRPFTVGCLMLNLFNARAFHSCPVSSELRTDQLQLTADSRVSDNRSLCEIRPSPARRSSEASADVTRCYQFHLRTESAKLGHVAFVFMPLGLTAQLLSKTSASSRLLPVFFNLAISLPPLYLMSPF